ncbi:hypothetical protein KSP40_PGU009051 [Platanthera guangdongensis]|uniref:Uncharacterized protein n=1 Tax=Platanthera guangdongensis TaxID=2320717 RepID=A0ABR2LL04_9ASPA
MGCKVPEFMNSGVQSVNFKVWVCKVPKPDNWGCKVPKKPSFRAPDFFTRNGGCEQFSSPGERREQLVSPDMDLLLIYADGESPEESLREPIQNSGPDDCPSSPYSSSDSPPHISLPAKTSAPRVDDTALALTAAVSDYSIHRPLDPSQHAVGFNPTYDQLRAPIYGPAHPYAKDGIAKGMRNHKLGFVEDPSIQSFLFDEQYNTFHKYGHAADPSGLSYVGDFETLERNQAFSIYNIPQQ